MCKPAFRKNVVKTAKQNIQCSLGYCDLLVQGRTGTIGWSGHTSMNLINWMSQPLPLPFQSCLPIIILFLFHANLFIEFCWYS